MDSKTVIRQIYRHASPSIHPSNYDALDTLIRTSVRDLVRIVLARGKIGMNRDGDSMRSGVTGSKLHTP